MPYIICLVLFIDKIIIEWFYYTVFIISFSHSLNIHIFMRPIFDRQYQINLVVASGRVAKYCQINLNVLIFQEICNEICKTVYYQNVAMLYFLNHARYTGWSKSFSLL